VVVDQLAEAGSNSPTRERTKSSDHEKEETGDSPDYTTTADLQKLLTKHQMPKNFTLLTETTLQLSCSEFYKKVISPGTQYNFETIF
jgi:hypothetical protein